MDRDPATPDANDALVDDIEDDGIEILSVPLSPAAERARHERLNRVLAANSPGDEWNDPRSRNRVYPSLMLMAFVWQSGLIAVVFLAMLLAGLMGFAFAVPVVWVYYNGHVGIEKRIGSTMSSLFAVGTAIGAIVVLVMLRKML
jgi:hypothetical protein